nr:hypothetical protein [Tanacetum cinerariifolium]
MSRDVLTVGSTMRIPLLYREEYSQWVERFMNYLEEQTDEEAMINSIKNGDQPLPRVTQVSIVGTSSTKQPPLKDKSMCNKTAKDLWDALARHMLGYEYGEQDRKAAVLYEYETFKATEGEFLLDTYIRYLQVINDLKKCGYSKDNCELNFKDVNDAMGLKKKTIMVTSDPLALIAEKTKVSKSKEKVDVSLDSEGSNADDFSKLKKITAFLPTRNKSLSRRMTRKLKKDDEKKQDMSKVKCYNCKKEGHFAKDCRKVKVKDYEYYKAKMLLVKKDKDEQVLLAEIKHRWNQAIADQEVLYDKISVQLVELDKHVRDLKNTVLEKDFKNFKLEECVRNKDQEIEKCLKRLNVCENKIHKMDLTNQSVHIIMPSKDNMYNGQKGIGFENSSYFCKVKDLRPILYDERVINLGYNLMFLTHSDEALEIEKFKRERENKIEFPYDYGSLNQTSSLKLYSPTVILEKIIIDLEDEVVSLLEKEKGNLKTIESLKSNDVETGVKSSEKVVSETKNKSENDCQEIEKVCDRKENPNVIAPRMFKLSVSQIVSPILMSKTSCASENVENKIKKRHLDTFSSVRRPKHSGVIWKKKGSSSTSNVDLSSVSLSKLNKDVKRYSRKDLLSCNNSHLGETSSACVCNDAMNVSCNSRLCDSFDENNLFIFDDESVRISPVSKMPFRKKPCDSLNIVHIYLWIINSGCSKHMTGNRALLTNFMEKFLGTVRFENNDFTVIAGYGDVVIGSMTIKKVYYVEGLEHNLFSVGQFCDNGLEVAFRKSTCFIRNEDGVDLLTESWLWHQRLSHLNFATINNLVKNNLVQGRPKIKFKKDHLCSAYEQGKIHRKHHKSKTAFALNKPLYLLHMDLCGPMRVESINGKRYVLVVVDDYSWHTWVFFLDVIFSFIKKTQVNLQLQVQRIRTNNGTEFKKKTHAKFFDEVGITQQFSAARTPQQNGVVESRNRTLVKAASTMLTFANLPLFLWAEAIAKACFTQNRSIIHKRFDKTPYELMNKRKPNLKFFHVFGCRCYLLNDYEDVGKAQGKMGYCSVCWIFKRIMKSSTMNVETSNIRIPSHEEEVFHESSESFQEESSSSSLDENIQQSLKEVGVPSSNTQSVSNNMVPNVDEASTSHNMFNERLKDTYFDASTSFHDPSNVHTFYQPYPHEKK